MKLSRPSNFIHSSRKNSASICIHRGVWYSYLGSQTLYTEAEWVGTVSTHSHALTRAFSPTSLPLMWETTPPCGKCNSAPQIDIWHPTIFYPFVQGHYAFSPEWESSLEEWAISTICSSLLGKTGKNIKAYYIALKINKITWSATGV